MKNLYNLDTNFYLCIVKKKVMRVAPSTFKTHKISYSWDCEPTTSNVRGPVMGRGQQGESRVAVVITAPFTSKYILCSHNFTTHEFPEQTSVLVAHIGHPGHLNNEQGGGWPQWTLPGRGHSGAAKTASVGGNDDVLWWKLLNITTSFEYKLSILKALRETEYIPLVPLSQLLFDAFLCGEVLLGPLHYNIPASVQSKCGEHT